MKVNIKVRDNYKSYCSLIDEEKILLNNKIVLDEKKNSRPDYKEKNTPTYSDVLPDDIILPYNKKKLKKKILNSFYAVFLFVKDLFLDMILRDLLIGIPICLFL